MKEKLNIILAQLNLMVGDIRGNLEKHLQVAKTASASGADVVVFPELSLTGYPPEDLLLRKNFIQDALDALQHFVTHCRDIYCVVGHPARLEGRLYNACSLIYSGKVLGQYTKQHLPNYGVFDEYRYFKPGHQTCVVPIHGIPTGLVICEDVWFPGPVQRAVAAGARVIFSPNASPFEVNKHQERVAMLSKRAKQNQVPILYANMVGGQDELIFDGGSMAFNAAGELCQLADFCQEALFPVELKLTAPNLKTHISPSLGTEEKIYQALILSLRDYINKNNFPGVLVGVSGGIDSALTLTMAVDALGKDRVHAVIMPSRYTAEMSMEDATQLTKALGVKTDIISIEPTYQSFINSLANQFTHDKPTIAEENIQARCRAVLLMALSNDSKFLVLTTGNRSELAVGYCTLYGDMAGGFGVLKDVPKTLVYQLALYRNHLQAVIPSRTIERPPTAELAPNQKDEDTLPPYSILDKILHLYLNDGQSIEEIIARGFNAATVEKIVKLIYKSEYKRRQAAIGPRINHQSFGKDWRYPVTNGFKG